MTGDAGILEQMREVSVEDFLLPLLVQLMIILAVARLFGWLFRKIGQTAVMGEITAGLILGPSVLGLFFPDVFAAIFRPEIPGLSAQASDILLSKVLMVLAQVGLVLLLFLIGLEVDFEHLRWHGRSALAISLGGVFVPFCLGAGLGWAMHDLVAPDIPVFGFALFMGTAMAITAIPVLGRMMLELGITRTKLAAITISSAAVDDACGWILLATVAATVRAAFAPLQTLGMIAATVVFALVMFALVRPLLRQFCRKALELGKGELGVNSLAVIFILLFLCSVITNRIGIFAIFGAFTLGAILSGEHAFRDAVNRRMRDFVTSFFLPIFFAYTGLRTNIGTLETWQLWGLALAVSAVAILGKFGGCSLMAWWTGLSRREAACVGAMMNTRGLMELIAINVGKDLGVIPDSVFCMLVLMALVTTFMTTPLLLFLMRGTELESYIVAAGMAEAKPPR